MQRWKFNVDLLALSKLLQHTDIRILKGSSQFLWRVIFWIVAHCLKASCGCLYRQVSLPSSSLFLTVPEITYATTGFHPVILHEKVPVRPTLFRLAFKGIVGSHILSFPPLIAPQWPLCFTADVSFHLLTFLPPRRVMIPNRPFHFFSTCDSVRQT